MKVIESDKLYCINKQAIFTGFRNGKKYLYLEKQGDVVPYFLKDEYIKKLEKLNKRNFIISELQPLFSEEIINELIYKELVIGVDEECNLRIDDINDNKRLAAYYKKVAETRTPIDAKFEITYDCNYKCEYCYIDGQDYKDYRYLSLENIEKILDELKTAGVINLFITGGEPLKHPQLMDILDYADNLGFVITLQTNGALITREIIEEFRKYKHFSVGISFHSYREEVFDKFTKVKGAFSNTIKTIHLLKEFDIRYKVKYTVTSKNSADAIPTIQYFNTNQIPFNVYTQILPNVSDAQNTTSYICDENVIEQLYKMGAMKFTKSTCSALISKCWIAPNGDLYPCELIRKKIGNLVAENFSDIWENDAAKEVLNSEIYNTPEMCKNCDKNLYCNKCIAYLRYYNWTDGLKQFCEMAKIIAATT